jgi:arylsulfatase A-like enzyme
MNVIWFVVDTLRADHLYSYGYFRKTSPNIDRLAKEGILFENSYASAIATGPGFTGLFTGLAAINHGFYLTPWNVANKPLLDDTIMTLPECIQVMGNYTTAAFDNLINFRSHMKQFVRGFEYYINITRSPAWLHHHIIADEINHRLLPWLEQHADEQFFAFVHYWDPHTPYNMPDKFRGKYNKKNGDLVTKTAIDGYEYVPGWGLANALHQRNENLTIDLYDDEVFYTDYCIGQVREKLEALHLLEETVIIITSDHGEDLDLHGLWGHGTVHNTTIYIPLIIRDPRLKNKGHRDIRLVQHADNMPTILRYFPEQGRPEFTRVNQPDWMPAIPALFDGYDLLNPEKNTINDRDDIVVESGAHRAYISPPWKLIWHKDGSNSELYHLENDPLELNNKADVADDVVQQLTGRLRSWVEKNLANKRSDPIYASDGAWTCYIGRKDES